MFFSTTAVFFLQEPEIFRSHKKDAEGDTKDAARAVEGAGF
jgi:hypothetical protein